MFIMLLHDFDICLYVKLFFYAELQSKEAANFFLRLCSLTHLRETFCFKFFNFK